MLKINSFVMFVLLLILFSPFSTLIGADNPATPNPKQEPAKQAPAKTNKPLPSGIGNVSTKNIKQGKEKQVNTNQSYLSKDGKNLPNNVATNDTNENDDPIAAQNKLREEQLKAESLDKQKKELEANSAATKKSQVGINSDIDKSETGIVFYENKIKINKLEESSDKEIQSTLSKSNVFDLQNPVFIISENVKTSNYDVSLDICNKVNLSGSSYNCLVYPVEDKTKIYSYLRRGIASDSYSKTGVTGDFLVIRSDVYSDYLQNKGYLKSSPPLDLVAYLNGDYFLIFSRFSKNVYSLDQLAGAKNKEVINVLAINKASEQVFLNLIKPMYPRSVFKITSYDKNKDNFKSLICDNEIFDLYIFIGMDFPYDAKEAISSCSKLLNPITFSDVNLTQITNANKIFSVVNVLSYYDSASVLNFIEIFLSIDREYKKKRQEEEDAMKLRATSKNKESSSKTKRLKNPNDNVDNVKSQDSKVLSSIVQSDERKESVINKEALDRDVYKLMEEKKNFNVKYLDKGVVLRQKDLPYIRGGNNSVALNGKIFPYIEEYLNTNERKMYVMGDAVIKSFGMRYVLVASRYTKKDVVYSFFDSIVSSYESIKNDFLGPDMKNFTVSDVALGTMNKKGAFMYHIGVYDYPRLLLEKKLPKTPEQMEILKVMPPILKDMQYATQYGPKFPDEVQLNYIYDNLKALNKKKQELNAIKIFQKDIANITQMLKSLESQNPNAVSLIDQSVQDSINNAPQKDEQPNENDVQNTDNANQENNTDVTAESQSQSTPQGANDQQGLSQNQPQVAPQTNNNQTNTQPSQSDAKESNLQSNLSQNQLSGENQSASQQPVPAN